MKKNIDTIVSAVAMENKEFITTTIADYIIESAESNDNWYMYLGFDEDITEEGIEELKEYLNKYWNYR